MWKLVSETTEDRKVGVGRGWGEWEKDNLHDARGMRWGAMGLGEGSRCVGIATWWFLVLAFCYTVEGVAYKACGPCGHLSQLAIYHLEAVRKATFVVKNKHQKYMYYDEIGLCAQNIDIIIKFTD